MKKVVLLFTTVLLIQITNAQMHISTNLRKDFTWNKSESKWEINSSDDESTTLFDFNKAQTMFTHTTSTISSTYYVKSFENDKENDTFTYEVVSDVGNKYRCILDIKNNNFRFIRKEKDGAAFLVRYTIKKIWFDDM